MHNPAGVVESRRLDASYAFAIIIPCYNEERRLPTDTLEEWAARHPNWCWLLVDDGSRDHTRSLLEGLAERHPNIYCLPLETNAGKAEAVRQGILTAHRDFSPPWLCYLDADFATPPQEIERLYELHSHSSYQLVLGCRLQRLGARITRKTLRHYIGRIAASMISLTLQLPTYDTQCGAKLIRSELVDVGFDKPFHSRWLFDVELLARCRNSLGKKQMRRAAIEEPLLEWEDVDGSRLNTRDFLRIPSELWWLHRIYNR